MKKLYMIAAMVVLPLMAFAWSYDLQDENAALDQMGYAVEKTYDFYGGYFNGEQLWSGDGCLTVESTAASIKLNKFDTFQVTNEGLTNFYIQIGTGAINLRANAGKDGLHNYGSGARYFAMADIRAGQIIVCQWGVQSGTNIVQPSDVITGGDACTWTDISDSIHALQTELDPETGADAFTYWRAETAGYFVIEMQRNSCIQGMQIWRMADEDEAVTAPQIKIAGVDQDSRMYTVTPGESTLGNEVLVYYTADVDEETGEVNCPLYLRDTDIVDHIDSIPQIDPESGDTIGWDETIVYKQEAYQINDEWGDYRFNPDEEEYLVIDPSMDDDGDGIVTLNMACITGAKAFSSIVTFTLDINAIQLNTPTLSLVGFDGTKRQYQVGWTNNTLCGEEYTFDATIDGQDGFHPALGETIEASDNIEISVSADGYITSEPLAQEVDQKDMNIYRANSEYAGLGRHDWCFLSDELQNTELYGDVYEKVIGEYVESAFSVNAESGDTIWYTRQQYLDGDVPEDAEPVYGNYGWDAVGSSRTWISVARDTTWTDSVTYEVNAYYYPGDLSGLTDGIELSCGPNTNNNSTIGFYTSNIGMYFMAKGTITIPNLKYGQYVAMQHGSGGTNYVTTTWVTIEQVPEDGTYVFEKPASSFLQYIDVYTYDDLPDGISYVGNVENAGNVGNIYNLAGQRVGSDFRGIVIMNGKKVMVN